jgi:uncharacterized membrane protein
MERKKKTKKLILIALFIALEIVMMYTPLGFLPIGVLQLTTLHIPVILAGILLGPSAGGIVGFAFGLASVVYATTVPNASSFIFSPFYSVGAYSGNIFSLVVALVPRIVLGLGAGWLYQRLSHHDTIRTNVSVIVTAVIMTLVHSVLVLGGIYVFFGPLYAQAVGVAYDALAKALVTVVVTNSLLEALLAALVCWPVYRAVSVVNKRGN